MLPENEPVAHAVNGHLDMARKGLQGSLTKLREIANEDYPFAVRAARAAAVVAQYEAKVQALDAFLHRLDVQPAQMAFLNWVRGYSGPRAISTNAIDNEFQQEAHKGISEAIRDVSYTIISLSQRTEEN